MLNINTHRMSPSSSLTPLGLFPEDLEHRSTWREGQEMISPYQEFLLSDHLVLEM